MHNDLSSVSGKNFSCKRRNILFALLPILFFAFSNRVNAETLNDKTTVKEKSEQANSVEKNAQLQSRSDAASGKQGELDSLSEGQRLDRVSCGFYSQGKYAEAIPPLLKSTEIYKKRLGPNHYYVGDNLTHIADMYNKQNDFQSAEKYYREAIAVFEKSGGSCQAQGCIEGLANILRATDRAKEADALELKLKNAKCPKPAK